MESIRVRPTPPTRAQAAGRGRPLACGRRPAHRLFTRPVTRPTVLLGASLALLAWAAAYPSQAQSGDEIERPESRPNGTVYLEYLAGVSFVGTLDLDPADAAGAGLGGEADPYTGYVFGAAIGAHLLDHFRAELQVAYNDARMDALQVQGEPDTGKGGISLLTVLANAYFDLETGLGVTPWVGAGIGWALAEFEARNSASALQLEVDDTDSVFVWNVMAGATVPVSESLAWSLGYRYVASEEMTLKSRAAGLPVRLETEWSAHQLIAGMRLRF